MVDVLKNHFDCYLDDCDFTIDDPRCDRTLEEFQRTDTYITAKENTWLTEEYGTGYDNGDYVRDKWRKWHKLDTKKTVEEYKVPLDGALYFDYGQLTRQKVGVLDYILRLLMPTVKEDIGVKETYWDNISFHLRVLELLYVAEAIPKNVYHEIFDGFTISDDKYLRTTKYIADVLTIKEHSQKESGKLLHVPISLSDAITLSFHWNIVAKELLRSKDGLFHENKVAFTEKMILYDILKKCPYIFPAERICLSDKERGHINKIPIEPILVSDTVAKHILYPIMESISLIEVYWDNVLFMLQVAEPIALKESLTRDLSVVKHDVAHIDDKPTKHSSKRLYDAFYIMGTMARTLEFIRQFMERVQTFDVITKDMTKAELERIHILERIAKGFTHALYDNVGIAESFNRSVAFRRRSEYIVHCSDIMQKYTAKNVSEQIALFEAYIRACNAVIEAVMVSDHALTTKEFEQQMEKPPLYEEFTDFNVGDYEYREALVRLRVISNATKSQPMLYDMSAKVDIDDTDDKGEVEITDTEKPTNIYFNKFYYNPPEVQVVLKGGMGNKGAMPHILRTDGVDDIGRYFTVAIYDDDGNLNTGRISWASKGW